MLVKNVLIHSWPNRNFSSDFSCVSHVISVKVIAEIVFCNIEADFWSGRQHHRESARWPIHHTSFHKKKLIGSLGKFLGHARRQSRRPHEFYRPCSPRPIFILLVWDARTRCTLRVSINKAINIYLLKPEDALSRRTRRVWPLKLTCLKVSFSYFYTA